MNIAYFCPRWGSDDLSWDDFLDAVKHAGYDGIEMGIPEDEKTRDMVLSKIEVRDLKFIAQHWETNDSDFKTHKKSYRYHLERLVKTKPFLLNSHTGKDYFTAEQNLELIQIATEISQQNNIIITHETHRGRFCFAAHITTQYLIELPQLPVTLDVSHWICVAESLLHDQWETIENCVPHVKHIHARIGYTEGPQVDDPRLKKWKETSDRHFEIWDKIINYHRSTGKKQMSFTTEFGPPPYMMVWPMHKSAISFQFELNLFMLQQLKKRYI